MKNVKEVLNSEMLNNEIDIEFWLKLMKVENYIINQDLTVSVPGSLNLEYAGLKMIPIQFSYVEKNFRVRGNQLTSFQGFPKKVGGYIDIRENKYTSIDGYEAEIGQNLICYDNPIKSLRNQLKSVQYISCENVSEFESFLLPSGKVVKVPLKAVNEYYKKEDLFNKLNNDIPQKEVVIKNKL